MAVISDDRDRPRTRDQPTSLPIDGNIAPISFVVNGFLSNPLPTFSVVPPVLAPVAKPIASPETFGRADIPMILAFRDEGMCFIASADGDGGRMHACF